jgi:hypothetical protein
VPLDKEIQAALQCRKVNLAENFEGERQVMLGNAWSDKLHEPRPAL